MRVNEEAALVPPLREIARTVEPQLSCGKQPRRLAITANHEVRDAVVTLCDGCRCSMIGDPPRVRLRIEADGNDPPCSDFCFGLAARQLPACRPHWNDHGSSILPEVPALHVSERGPATSPTPTRSRPKIDGT